MLFSFWNHWFFSKENNLKNIYIIFLAQHLTSFEKFTCVNYTVCWPQLSCSTKLIVFTCLHVCLLLYLCLKRWRRTVLQLLCKSFSSHSKQAWTLRRLMVPLIYILSQGHLCAESFSGFLHHSALQGRRSSESIQWWGSTHTHT